ncbi:hypothetical protein VNI00_018230 [Paramarasmius palmivorus]|uniref:Uncharacterized protein n=1 Tax=Paramarasmius palmivorus TaxID=297713 RepID=A0AAW0AZJ4_9AGAR
MQKATPWRYFRWVQTIGFGLAIKSFMVAQWDVIAKSHRWLFGLMIFIAYLSWAGSLAVWEIDIGKYYYDMVLNPTWTYEHPEKFNLLVYSQLLALAVAVEPLWAVAVLSFESRRSILSWLKNCPGEIWRSTVFIFMGRYNPWRKIKERQRTASSE